MKTHTKTKRCLYGFIFILGLTIVLYLNYLNYRAFAQWPVGIQNPLGTTYSSSNSVFLGSGFYNSSPYNYIGSPYSYTFSYPSGYNNGISYGGIYGAINQYGYTNPLFYPNPYRPVSQYSQYGFGTLSNMLPQVPVSYGFGANPFGAPFNGLPLQNPNPYYPVPNQFNPVQNPYLPQQFNPVQNPYLPQQPLANQLVADVTINATNDGEVVDLAVDKILGIELESNPSTGYRWELDPNSYNSDIIAKLSNQILPPMFPSLGSTGLEKWLFKAVGTGNTTLFMQYKRPWEQENLYTFTITVQVI